MALARLISEKLVLSGICLALATHMSVYPVLLLPPMMKGLPARPRIALALSFSFSFAAIMAANYFVLGMTWIRPTWGTM
jgi:hypothetical protein